MVQLDGFPEWHQHLIIRSRVAKICTSTVLSREELLWTLCEWDPQTTLTQDEARLLVKSALRRSETLWYWLSLLDGNSVYALLSEAVVSDIDRDPSDSSNTVVEIAATFLTESQVQELKSALVSSSYKHFQEAAEKLGTTDQIYDAAQSKLEKFLKRSKLDPSSAAILEAAKDKAAETLKKLKTSKCGNRNLLMLGKAYYYAVDRARSRHDQRTPH